MTSPTSDVFYNLGLSQEGQEQERRCLGQMVSVSGILRLGDLLQVWPGRRVQAETVTLFKIIKVMHKAAVKSSQHRVR